MIYSESKENVIKEQQDICELRCYQHYTFSVHYGSVYAKMIS